MADTRLLVVIGATGNQGGSVVEKYLDLPGWKIRGVTRNANSDKAKKLAERGVEMVTASLDDTASLDTAFDGAHAIFLVSDFWGLYFDPSNAGKAAPGESLNVWAGNEETKQLITALNAASRVSTLQRLVISSLPHCTKWSGGKYTHVYHFDSKAKAVEYVASSLPELWAKTSVFLAGLFLLNYTGVTRPNIENGTVKFAAPIDADLKLPFIAPEEDIGPLVQTLTESSPGKNLIAYREWMTSNELVAAFTRATGMFAEYVRLTPEEAIVSMPEDLKPEVVDNWACFNEFGFECRNDPTVVHPSQLEHAPKLGSVEEWFAKQGWSFLRP